MLMDSTSTTSEFVKESQSSQLLVMLVSSSTPLEDALPAQLDAELVQAPLFVQPVPKLDSPLLMELAEPFVAMESLLDLNNVMIETLPETTAARLLAQLRICGLAQANLQSVLTTAQLFAEMAELKETNNAMMETW